MVNKSVTTFCQGPSGNAVAFMGSAWFSDVCSRLGRFLLCLRSDYQGQATKPTRGLSHDIYIFLDELREFYPVCPEMKE